VADYCEVCRKCIHKCPADAILEEPRILADGTPSFIEPEKCAVPFSEGCSVCISCCPFTGGHYDRLHDKWLLHQKRKQSGVEDSREAEPAQAEEG
jgi:epoxyqueuosine reductase QueG